MSADGLDIAGSPGRIRLGAFPDAAGVAHAFSTRQGGVSGGPYTSLNLGLSVGDDPEAVRENRRRFFAALGVRPEEAVRVRQVHGAEVLVVDEALAGRSGFPRLLLDEGYQFDAIVTDMPGLALTISTADCIPILLYDPGRRAIAAVHAGWRSTTRRIAERAVRAMTERFGTDPAGCFAALGPGMRGCCYEVDRPVVEPLARAIPSWADFAAPVDEGHWLLDLAGVNARILREAGLRGDRILDTGLCTGCRRDLFFSYRAERPTTGRMMNTILLCP